MLKSAFNNKFFYDKELFFENFDLIKSFRNEIEDNNEKFTVESVI